MAILATGNTFATGNQVTASTLNAAVNSSTFDTGAVDNSTTALSGGAIIVKDGGVTMAKLASASNGQIPIGNGSGFTAATLTAGTNIGITNASGSVTVAFSGTLPIANGGTGAVTAAAARAALELAAPIRCTADVNVVGTSYSDITGLTTNVTSGTTYVLESNILYSVTTGTLNLRLTGTATVSSLYGISVSSVSTASLTKETGTSLPVTIGNNTDLVTSTSTACAKISISFVCSGSGTLKWQIAGLNVGNDVTAKQWSYMKLLAY